MSIIWFNKDHKIELRFNSFVFLIKNKEEIVLGYLGKNNHWYWNKEMDNLTLSQRVLIDLCIMKRLGEMNKIKCRLKEYANKCDFIGLNIVLERNFKFDGCNEMIEKLKQYDMTIPAYYHCSECPYYEHQESNSSSSVQVPQDEIEPKT